MDSVYLPTSSLVPGMRLRSNSCSDRLVRDQPQLALFMVTRTALHESWRSVLTTTTELDLDSRVENRIILALSTKFR